MGKGEIKKISDSRYYRLFMTARDGIIIINSKTRKIIDANPISTILLNCPSVSLIGKDFSEIEVFKNKKEIQELLSKSNRAGETSFEGFTLRDNKGNVRILKLITHTYNENGDEVIQFSARDITERKQSEQYMLESKRRLDALMNALPVGVSFSTDTTCEYITGNPALLRKLEMNPGDNISSSSSNINAPGRHLKHFINGIKVSAKDMPMQRAITENRIVGPMEIEVKLPSGSKWVHEAIAAPIHDSKGNVVASVAVNVDLTERKRAEEATRLEEIMNQEKLKIDFIADATHELRTPLTIIKGNVDLALRSGLDKHDPIRHTLHAIDHEVMQLATLISDLSLLTSSKGGDLQMIIKSQKINLKKLLEETAHRHEGFAKKKEIEIMVGDLPEVSLQGDKAYLEKLFSNIITNAIAYGKQKGHIKICAFKTAKTIRVHVEDDGIGIPKKDLPHIFKRFYRVDSSRSKDFGGRGLGLAIVKWIAEAHGGDVTATSSEKKGSTFSVTLPLNKKY